MTKKNQESGLNISEFENKVPMTKHRKYNIAIFSNQSHPIVSGAADVVSAHCEELTKLGYNVTLFCEPLQSGYTECNVSYRRYRFDVYNGLDIDIKYPGESILSTVDPQILSIFEKSEFDFVYTHAFGNQSYVGMVLAKKFGIPHLAHMHTNFMWGMQTEAEKLIMVKALRDFFSNATAVVYTNEYCKQIFSKMYQIEHIPGEVVNNASLIPTDVDVTDDNCPYRTAWLCNDSAIMAYSGRVEYEQKNIEFILQVLKKLVLMGCNIRLWVIGTGGGMMELVSRVVELGLQAYVIICGVFEDKVELKKIISETDFLMFPSYYDTDGISIKDFAVCGKPSVLLEDSICAQDKKDCGSIIVSPDVDKAAETIYNLMEDSKWEEYCDLSKSKLGITWESVVTSQLIPLFNKYRKEVINNSFKVLLENT